MFGAYGIRRHLTRLGLLVAVCLASGGALGQTGAPPPPPEAPRSAEAASREALKAEIRKYSALVQAMRESLAVREDGAQRTDEIEATVRDLTAAVGAITEQLADLELNVEDNQVSLRDGRGGQVTLEIPDNLSEQLSSSISTFTRRFLQDMPDTVRIGDTQTGFTWDLGQNGLQIVPLHPRRERRVIEGGLVKVRDDLEVAADEDVLGDAVGVLGDATIAGRIRGDLVVVLGDVLLTETAEVDGRVVTVLGRLDREPGAKVASVTVVSPGRAALSADFFDVTRGWGSFLVFQGLFVGLVILALLLLAIVPRARCLALVDAAERRPAPCLGLGLLAVLAGHAVVVGLAAILVLTVIGIPVALLALVALLLLDLAGVVVGAMVVGRTLCRRLGLGCPHLWRELLLGLLVLHLPAFLASLLGAFGAPGLLVGVIAWFGGLVKLVAFAIGLGALLLSRFGGQPGRPPVQVQLDPLPEPPLR
ncbi:MAG: hypothetical protein R3D98_08460 [Candidatus Krumholzibacteriia bacterium]